MEEPNSPNIWEISDFRTPWCVHVVATLRIAEHIANNIHSIEDLAEAASCNASILQAVMDHLVGRGVFERLSPGQYGLNKTSQQLLDPNAQHALNLDGLGGRFAHAWGTLLPFVRTGRPAYEELFGLPFFEDLAAHPHLSGSFDALMGPAGHSTPDPHFSLTVGWERLRIVVDVGGGTGSMLAEVLQAHPHLHGILVDLPHTVERAGKIFQDAGVADRVKVVGQSFFDTLPSGADLYLLRGVLNDWPDREAVAILRRCAEAVHPEGRVVIIKGAVPDDAPKELAIEMVLVGGKQRTISEFRELAQKAGLHVTAADHQPSGHSVIECRLMLTSASA